jgi:hypothetical protein
MVALDGGNRGRPRPSTESGHRGVCSRAAASCCLARLQRPRLSLSTIAYFAAVTVRCQPRRTRAPALAPGAALRRWRPDQLDTLTALEPGSSAVLPERLLRPGEFAAHPSALRIAAGAIQRQRYTNDPASFDCAVPNRCSVFRYGVGIASAHSRLMMGHGRGNTVCSAGEPHL